MLYLLLILFPITMAVSSYVVRKQTELVITSAICVLIAQMALVTQIPLDEPIRLLGVTFTLNALTRLFLLVFLFIGMVMFLATWRLPHGENFVPVGLLVLGLTSTILMLQDPFIVSLLLIAAGLAVVLALVDLPPRAGVLVGAPVIAAALKYLLLMAIAGVLMYLGYVLVDIYRPGELPGRIPLARFILALLAAGFALRLALIPFHTWLSDITDTAAPMVTALNVAILNVASLLVLILSFQRFPVLLLDNATGLTLLRLAGLVTGVVGGLLALGQPTLRRALGYLLVYNSGMIFYGLASISTIGLMGAIFEALNQILAATLILVSLGLLEQPDGRPPGFVRRDLLRRWPVAGLGLLGGLLALVGLPPFSGFASKVLLYETAAQQHWLELPALLLASVLAGLAVVRVAHLYLLGPSEETAETAPLLLGETELDRPAPRRLAPEPRTAAMLVLLLLALSLVIGVYPQPWLASIDDVIRGLTFVRAVE